MPWTVAGMESELVGAGGRLSGWVAMANQIGAATSPPTAPIPTATGGSNPFLRGPIRKALGWVGVTPASPPAVSDADLVGLSAWGAEKCLDAATLEGLYALAGSFVGVDMQVGQNMQRLSQLSAQIQAQIKALETRLSQPYGPNMAAGAIGNAPGLLPNDPFRPCSRAPWYSWPYPPVR